MDVVEVGIPDSMHKLLFMCKQLHNVVCYVAHTSGQTFSFYGINIILLGSFSSLQGPVGGCARIRSPHEPLWHTGILSALPMATAGTFGANRVDGAPVSDSFCWIDVGRGLQQS